jgi:hypothetical protein
MTSASPDPSVHNGWTKTWPTAPGHYWFYGVLSKGESLTEHPVASEVWLPKGDIPVYVVGGSFVHKAEGTFGFWKEIEFPPLPEWSLECATGPD